MYGGIVRKLVRAKKFRLFLWAFLLQGWLDSIITPSPPSLLQSNIQVSHTFHPDVSVNSALVSHMTTQWGQFLDHDISRTPTEETEGCYLMPESENCFPIVIPRNDLFYLTLSTPQTCQKFSRSIAFCEDLSPVREQMNEWGGDWLVQPSTASKPCSSKNWWMATGFSFTHKNQTGSFIPTQLAEIRKMWISILPNKKTIMKGKPLKCCRRLSDILCENTGIAMVRGNVFLDASTSSQTLKPCSEARAISIDLFV